MRQPWTIRAVTVLFMTLALVGCKGGKAGPAPTTTPAATASAAPASASCSIPQNNGGDQDADNNGGPNDGDGCDK